MDIGQKRAEKTMLKSFNLIQKAMRDIEGY